MKYYVICAAFILTMFLIYCSHKAEEQEAQAVITPVKTELSKLELIRRPILTSGILAPVSQMKLSFKTGGIIERIDVDEGMQVRKGQLLAQLDMREIEAQFNQAKSAYEKARRDYKRAEKLFNDSVATKEQFQNAQTGLDMAKAGYEVAEFNYKYSSIKAPANGSILYRLAEEKELIGPGHPVLVFGTTGQEWLIRAGVNEKDLLRLNIGDSAKVTFDAYPDKEFSARVNEIAEAANPMNGTFEVELLIRKNELPLKAGFVAKIKIFPSKGKRFITIPIESLVDADENSAYIYTPTVEKDSVKKMQISIAFVYNNRIAVSTGLKENTEVITSGSSYLNENSRINIQN
jgi:multidrug efflux system membrane fusion protein